MILMLHVAPIAITKGRDLPSIVTSTEGDAKSSLSTLMIDDRELSSHLLNVSWLCMVILCGPLFHRNGILILEIYSLSEDGRYHHMHHTYECSLMRRCLTKLYWMNQCQLTYSYWKNVSGICCSDEFEKIGAC